MDIRGTLTGKYSRIQALLMHRLAMNNETANSVELFGTRRTLEVLLLLMLNKHFLVIKGSVTVVAPRSLVRGVCHFLLLFFTHFRKSLPPPPAKHWMGGEGEVNWGSRIGGKRM